MKTRYILLPIALLVLSSLSLRAQSTQGAPKTDAPKAAMTDRLGAPTYESTFEGLHAKIWVMSRDERAKMMQDRAGRQMGRGNGGGMGRGGMHPGGMQGGGMQHGGMGRGGAGMGIDKGAGETAASATHHIMLEMSDAASGKPVGDATVVVQVVSPSNRDALVTLKSMANHLGGPLTLTEKGKYQLTVSVTIGKATKTTEFIYTVE